MTSLHSAVVTFANGAPIGVVKAGSNVQFYYNGNLLTTQTVDNASLIGNTYHGLLATDAEVTLDNFSIVDS